MLRARAFLAKAAVRMLERIAVSAVASTRFGRKIRARRLL